MNDVLTNIKTRRSIRKFKDSQVERQDLEKILEAGLDAPSARNTQNWQLTVVQGEEKLTDLHKTVARAIGNPDYHKFYNAPTLVLVSTPSDYVHGPFDSSVVLQNIFLAAHSLEVGSVWINQLQDISDNPEVRTVLSDLGVPENHRVYGCAALGYAAVKGKTERENKGKIVFA